MCLCYTRGGADARDMIIDRQNRGGKDEREWGVTKTESARRSKGSKRGTQDDRG